MSKRKPQSLTFKSLLLSNPAGLGVALLIGAISCLAGIALLAISGWFLSAAGLASVLGTALVFNYFTPGALIRLMAILRTAGRYGEQVMAHDFLLGLLRSLRLWVWDQRVATPMQQLHQQTHGDLLQRIVGDLDQVIKWPLAVLMPWLYGLLACAGVMGLAAWVAPQLVWPVLLYSVLQLVFLPWLAQRLAARAVYSMQVLATLRRGRFMGLFQALITLTIRGNWQSYSARLDMLDQRQKQAQQRLQKVSSSIKLVSQLLTFLLLVAVIASVVKFDQAALVLREAIAAPWLVALLLSILGLNEVLQPLAQSFIAQGQSKVGLKRLNQLQQAPTVSSNVVGISSIEQLQVTDFIGRYSSLQRAAQQRAKFVISTGQSVRITGPSGAGKSACLAALAGDIPYLGQVLVNGQSININDHNGWCQRIAYLPQQAVIFQQSLAANLRLGDPDASDEQLRHVLAILGLGEWLQALPQGLNTLLGAQGRDVSGGQARRIALARVLLRQSDVLLLDEPFDGLDKVSIARVCEALDQPEFRPKLLLYVSHVATALDQRAKAVTVQ
ncbi:amino acid ABC transporter ATP-binding/permease protein [Marinomonas ostreistagni]|uniref:amino acid ABC transporter ATP-binding/permease protein n=1 Tax=Marinomonas ostreistagni TaxID=359209 RepID=UPI00194E6D7F|nr:ATP-binding cassette domain-containing protein [Marinomonas ostreistagni]MBM6551759.1 ATP-binding cassette domain-containing protein [Marinomonas ostreistagni]